MSRLRRFVRLPVIAILCGSALLIAGIYRITRPTPVVAQPPSVAVQVDANEQALAALRDRLRRIASLERCNMADLHAASLAVGLQLDVRSPQSIAQSLAVLADQRRIRAAEVENLQHAQDQGERALEGMPGQASVPTRNSFEGLQRNARQTKALENETVERLYAAMEKMLNNGLMAREHNRETGMQAKSMAGYQHQVYEALAAVNSLLKKQSSDWALQWLWLDHDLGGTVRPEQFYAACPSKLSIALFDARDSHLGHVPEHDLDVFLDGMRRRWSAPLPDKPPVNPWLSEG
jgi:hypothetical protein